MVTKTQNRVARLYKYKIRGVSKKEVILARNEQDAVNKAARMFPRARVLGIERVSHTGREYEVVWINL